ncbi:MAG: IPTL-CTERM sorting domain-containing protein [Acidobacteriota bacterium]
MVGDPAGAAMADFAVTNALDIPTLDQRGLILLIALLAVAAVRRLHVV